MNTDSVLDIKNFSLHYGKKQALKSVSVSVRPNSITSLIASSGCGKSTLLRSINRMNDHIRDVRFSGEINLHGEEVLSSKINLEVLRTHVGMVFQKPNPFPKSIADNILWALKIHGRSDKKAKLEKALKDAFLWEEVKDRLDQSALSLSGGQQQRLCIARALALEPEILLLDEPCSALDPTATAKVEEMLMQVKKQCTVIIVTHNMAQARRISDITWFMHNGELVEAGPTELIFQNAKEQRTRDYIEGKFG